MMGALKRTVKTIGRDLDLFQRRLRFSILTSPLNPRRLPVLDKTIFDGKRVIILGPARTVFDDVKGLDVDGFDVVVRLNNGIALARQNPQDLGSRTDVLFHNLNETGPRNAGEIPASLLEAHKVKFCVFPHWTFRGSKKRLYEKRKELASHPQISLLAPPPAFCEQVRRWLGGLKPTTGTSAILYFLHCEIAELHIHGFTFFETPYAGGYNDAVKTDKDAAKWVADSNIHDPALEKAVIRDQLEQARQNGKTVLLGRNVPLD